MIELLLLTSCVIDFKSFRYLYDKLREVPDLASPNASLRLQEPRRR